LEPPVRLKGVAHGDTTFITIEIRGLVNAEAATATDQEVVVELAKAGSGSITKGS
jgi:hypothetical protein